MKKLTIVAAIAGLCIAQLNTQAQDDKKLSFGINVGAGIPMGDYSKTDSTKLPLSSATTNRGKANDTTKYNGFAKTGFHFSVYGQYMIAGPIGVKLLIGGTMNSFDITSFNSTYASILTENGSASPGQTFPTFTASKSYYIGQYLVGPCLKLPAGDKLRIEAQILVGLVTANYPSLSYTYSTSGGTAPFNYSETGTETYSSSSGSGFGYNIGAGLEYMATDMIGLHLNVGYTGSSLSYSSYTQASSSSYTFGGTTSSSSSAGTYNIPKTMSMGLLQITVGVSIDI